jgi:hypothetical protein
MKRTLSLALCLLVVHTIMAADAYALFSTPAPPPSRHATQVATAVAHPGTGEDSVVALRLQNKTVLKGARRGAGSRFVCPDRHRFQRGAPCPV